MAGTRRSIPEFDDIDLMHYADGELDPDTADALAAYLDEAGAGDDRAKVRSLEQMSDVLSTYLELEADAVEPRLDAMWEAIRENIHETEAAAAAVHQPVAQPRRQAEPEGEGIWASIVRFFDGYRGHILTGAVAAGAAAAIILALRPPERVTVPAEVPVAQIGSETGAPATRVVTEPRAQDPGALAPATTDPKGPIRLVSDESTAPEVDELEVENGSGMVFMMPGERDDPSATVIFLNLDDIEGPL